MALKFMLGQVAANHDAVAWFMREGKAAARLRSEHVAQVLDVWAAGTVAKPYMVMEFLDGRDLSDLIKAEGPQPVERAVLLRCSSVCGGGRRPHVGGHRSPRSQAREPVF